MGSLKPKKCRECPERFIPYNSTQTVCSPECGIKKAKRERWAKEKREYNAKKKHNGRAKSGPQRQAAEAVHHFILVRDSNKPCIVHGWECPHADKGWHAGHFQSVGSEPALRFNTWNIHKQCGISNTGSEKRARWGKGTAKLYEENLVKRIGQARVDFLKGSHKPKQYREIDLNRIAEAFRKKSKHYKKLNKKLRGIE